MACFPWRLAFCILKLNAAVQKLEDGCFLCGGPKARSGEPIMYRATDFYVGFAFRCEGCSKDVPGKFTLPICTYLLFRTLGNLHLQHSRRREYWKAGEGEVANASSWSNAKPCLGKQACIDISGSFELVSALDCLLLRINRFGYRVQLCHDPNLIFD